MLADIEWHTIVSDYEGRWYVIPASKAFAWNLWLYDREMEDCGIISAGTAGPMPNWAERVVKPDNVEFAMFRKKE